MRTNKMNLIMIVFLMMASLSLSAQTASDQITLNDKDFGLASISEDIQSADINGKTYYYTVVQSNPNYAVIVGKKNAYIKFKEVVLPETFTASDGKTMTIVGIGVKAFANYMSIQKVDLPKTVRIIGDEAFVNTDVDDLSLKEGLVKIGDKAFQDNDLRNIHIPDGVEEIGEEAFYCYKTTIFQRGDRGTLYIPKSVYNIGNHAFAMARNMYGAWFNSRRKILCLPDYVNLNNCKDMGISKEPVKEYLKSFSKK